MHVMSGEFVEEVWQSVAGLDGRDAEILSTSFAKKQPALVNLILMFSEKMSQGAHELAYYLGLVIWQCYHESSQKRLKSISENAVIQQHERVQQWLESMEAVDNRFLIQRIQNLADHKQPAILQYIVEAIFESDSEEGEDTVVLTPDEEGGLFTILKVVMDCLDQAWTQDCSKSPTGGGR